MNIRTAVSHINRHGILLVYPIHNRKEPPSLWSSFFPRSEMRWEWDSGGDNRVAELWHLREQLSRSGRVVYAKWYQGRATLFSREAFTALLGLFRATAPAPRMREAGELLSILEDTSPLSTKQLKRAAELEGKFFESTFQRAMKELWSRLLVVGYGEIEDGAFPSLAMGATQLMFEELWRESEGLDAETAGAKIKSLLPAESPFLKFVTRLQKGWEGSAEPSLRVHAKPSRKLIYR